MCVCEAGGSRKRGREGEGEGVKEEGETRGKCRNLHV